MLSGRVPTRAGVKKINASGTRTEVSGVYIGAYGCGLGDGVRQWIASTML